MTLTSRDIERDVLLRDAADLLPDLRDVLLPDLRDTFSGSSLAELDDDDELEDPELDDPELEDPDPEEPEPDPEEDDLDDAVLS